MTIYKYGIFFNQCYLTAGNKVSTMREMAIRFASYHDAVAYRDASRIPAHRAGLIVVWEEA